MAECSVDGFITTQEKSATEEIRSSLKIYGEDVLSTKFPNVIDGLKNVTRRIIYFSQFDMDLISMNKFISNVFEVHVGGDSSIYDAIVRLGQEFMVGHPLVTIQGNRGKYYYPDSAAHPRYLKAKLSEFARDIFFKGIHPKTIPMVPLKDFTGMEPQYLIPKLPTALIFGNLTVGFGYKSYTPMIDFPDVCKLVSIFAEFYSKNGVGIPKRSATAKYVVPTFPIKNLVRNKVELINQYLEGCYSYPLEIEGWLELNGTTITLRAVPYGVDFNTVTTKFNNLIRQENEKNKSSWLCTDITNVSQYSASDAEYTIHLKRGRNPFAILEKLRTMLYFNKKWTPIYSYLHNDRVYPLNPILVVEAWYRERVLSISGGLKYRQTDLILKKMQLEAMLKVVDHKKEVIEIIENANDEDDTVNQLAKRFNDLTWRQAKIIAGLKLLIFNRCSRQQIEADIEQTEADLQNTLAMFGKVHEIIASDAQLLSKKYASTNETKFSCDFTGYVQFGDWGVIQFFNENHMIDILASKNWPSDLIKTIHLYDPRKSIKWVLRNGNTSILNVNSKEIFCEKMECHPYHRLPYTCCVNDGNICIVNSPVTCPPAYISAYPITSSFWAIHRNGKVTQENVDNYTIRKNICQGIRSDIVAAIPDDKDQYLIFYMCTSAPNMLRIARIPQMDKLVTVPTGKIKFLGIYPVKTSTIYLNIPEDCVKNCTVQYLLIYHAENLCSQKAECIYLNKLPKSTRDSTIKTLYRLDGVKERKK